MSFEQWFKLWCVDVKNAGLTSEPELYRDMLMEAFEAGVRHSVITKDDVDFILVYVPEAELLDFDTSLTLAYERDTESAVNFMLSLEE